ncbi:MAG TPA: hypothetical protein VH137_00625 [Gemmatimonadales bacterium]|nr:hypothetical protein [Gemmatimonadales bacterium]
MSGRGTEKRAMSDAILVRVTPEAGAAVEALATAMDLSRAAWLRGLAVSAAGLSPAETRRSQPVAPPELPREDVAALALLIGVVGKACGATIQLAKGLRELGVGALHAEAEAVLGDLRASQRALVRIIEHLRTGVDREDAT